MSGHPLLDSLEFARKGDSLSGTLAVKDLERLGSSLFENSGEVRYALDGFVNRDGDPGLRMRIDGSLRLTCQRCLGPLEFELSTNREFVLVGNSEELGDVAEESALLERILADPRLDVIEFVESEILLEFPLSPLHRPGDCSPPDWGSLKSGNNRPFGALDALKRNS
jgi:uncharacterized protein